MIGGPNIVLRSRPHVGINSSSEPFKNNEVIVLRIRHLAQDSLTTDDV